MKENNNERMLGLIFLSAIIIIASIIAFPIGQSIIKFMIIPICGLVGAYFLYKRNLVTLEMIFLLTISQNIFLTLISSHIDKSTFSFLLMFKEIYIIFIVLISMFILFKDNEFSYKKVVANTNKLDYISIVIAVVLFIYTLTYGAPGIKTRLVSARQVAIPVLFYLLGRSIILNKDELVKFLKFVKFFAIAIVIFGIVELLIGDKLWLDLGISKFIEYKDMQQWTHEASGLPGNFYSYDLYNQIGVGIRRMVSFIMEPTTLSQLLASILMFTYWIKPVNENNKKRNICSLILLIGVILTFGKGGIVIAIICCIYNLKDMEKYKKISKYFGVAIIGISTFVIIYSFSNKTSVSFHMKGLIDNFMQLIEYPFGRGIGMSGNFASLYATGNYEVGHGESYVGIIIGQFGLIGILIFGLFYYLMYKELKTIINENISLKSIATVCQGLLLGCLVASLLSESAISFISTILIFPIIGVVININLVNKLRLK